MEHIQVVVAVVFILFIVVESVISSCLEFDNFDFKDSLSNFAIAGLGAMLTLFFKSAAFIFYLFIYRHTPLHLETRWWSLGLLFLLTDLFYYLFHRLSHESRFFWASHVVHHSSEKFNLTTALRSPITSIPFRFVFAAPLALMGFAPHLIVLMDSVVLFYTFFTHTEIVGKLGWVEKVFNTPSHHRVHHGSDSQYLDKNYGGVLIIWDKLFGTFQPETQRPVYGLTKPIHTYNPLKIVVGEWVQLAKDAINATNCRDRWMRIFGRPGWQPAERPLIIIKGNVFTLVRVLALLVLCTVPGHGQSAQELISQGAILEQQWREDMALNRYLLALDKEPANLQALIRGSRMLCNVGGRSKDKDFKKAQVKKAREFALRAIAIDYRSPDAHLCYILSLGIEAEMAGSPREKLAHARTIKTEADLILTFDPNFAPAYYILGKWHYAIASLSPIERMAAKLLFGGVPPGASIDDALRCYNKAITLWPDYILFYYSKALVLNYKGEREHSALALETALRLKPLGPDDLGRLRKCEQLLAQTKTISLK